MLFSSYALSVLLLLGLLCDMFTLTNTTFPVLLFEDIIMYYVLVTFCLVPGYAISYSECLFY